MEGFAVNKTDVLALYLHRGTVRTMGSVKVAQRLGEQPLIRSPHSVQPLPHDRRWSFHPSSNDEVASLLQSKRLEPCSIGQLAGLHTASETALVSSHIDFRFLLDLAALAYHSCIARSLLIYLVCRRVHFKRWSPATCKSLDARRCGRIVDRRVWGSDRNSSMGTPTEGRVKRARGGLDDHYFFHGFGTTKWLHRCCFDPFC
jgi:hypothetical protein